MLWEFNGNLTRCGCQETCLPRMSQRRKIRARDVIILGRPGSNAASSPALALPLLPLTIAFLNFSSTLCSEKTLFPSHTLRDLVLISNHCFHYQLDPRHPPCPEEREVKSRRRSSRHSHLKARIRKKSTCHRFVLPSFTLCTALAPVFAGYTLLFGPCAEGDINADPSQI